MTKAPNNAQRDALLQTMSNSYVEIFPTPTIESRLDGLPPASYIAVTCSPTKGIDETLNLCDRLARRGFRVVPHVAARMVRNRQQLREIVRRLDDTDIVSLFVPGGDVQQPAGDYASSLDVLRDIADIEHRFKEIGVAAHPEPHPFIDDVTLFDQLLKKQEYADYVVTQMCFDAATISRWIDDVREQGLSLPIWLGIPGAVNRAELVATSLKIGVGDSVRFLKHRRKNAAQILSNRNFVPDELLLSIAPTVADPAASIHGYHIFCFNQVKRSVRWREDFVTSISED